MVWGSRFGVSGLGFWGMFAAANTGYCPPHATTVIHGAPTKRVVLLRIPYLGLLLVGAVSDVNTKHQAYWWFVRNEEIEPYCHPLY